MYRLWDTFSSRDSLWGPYPRSLPRLPLEQTVGPAVGPISTPENEVTLSPALARRNIFCQLEKNSLTRNLRRFYNSTTPKYMYFIVVLHKKELVAMAKQESPKQMRITDETMDQIRAIAKETGGTQQDVMSLLLQLYQAEQAKETLPDRAKDIEQYRVYMDAAQQMYLTALQDAATIADTTKTKYSGLIESLQTQVTELRTKCDTADQSVAAAKAAEAEAKAKVEGLDSRVAELTSALADKVRIVEGLERQIADMQTAVDQAKQSADDLVQRDQRIQALEQQVHQLSEDLAQAKSAHEFALEKAALAHQTELLNVKREHQEQLDQVRKEYLAQIDSRQAAYQDLLQTVASMQRQGTSPSAGPTSSTDAPTDPDQMSLPAIN